MGLPTDRAKLEQYFSDDAATEALALVRTSDPDAAKDLLLLAAGYIERGVALPGNLADYLVNAIETAMAKPTQKQRAKALTVALGLTALHKRPVSDWASVGADIERHINEFHSDVEKALQVVSKNYGIDKRTAERNWHDYKLASAEVEDDLRQKLPPFCR